MKHHITLLVLFLYGWLSPTLTAQDNNYRYQAPIFDEITVFEDIVYGQAVPYSLLEEETSDDYAFDFYEPSLDDATKRPLVLMFSDGGFVFGQKRSPDMVTLCDSLARYGYACASLDYRQNFDATNPQSMVRAVYRAVQDARSAIRYFKEYHETFRIDTSQIYLGGKRAGAIIALHTAYMNDEKERPTETFMVNSDMKDLGCLDCSGNPFSRSVDVAGVINIGGALYDPSIIDNDKNVSAVNIHARNDDVIPINLGHLFESDFQKTFPLVYGSQCIHDRLDSLGCYSEFHPVDEQEEIYGFTALGYASGEVMHKMVHFLQDRLSFQTAIPKGDYAVCEGFETSYTIEGLPESMYEWEVENGRIIEQIDNKITIKWYAGVQQGSLRVTEISAGKVRGVPSPKLLVEIKPQPSAEYELDYINDNTVIIYDQSAHGEFCNLNFDFNGATASGKTGKSFTYSYAKSGDYMIAQTVESQCGISINQIPVHVEVTKEVEQKFLEEAVKVFPKALKQGETTIISIQQVRVLPPLTVSLLGENKDKLYFEQINPKEGDKTISLDTSSLSKGTYLVQISSEDLEVNRELVIK